MHHVSKKTRGFLLLCMMVFALTSCIGQKKPKVISHVSEDKIPHKIAVLPAIYMAPEDEEMSIGIKSGSEEEKFVCDLVRGVIHNQLAGKGYSAQPLDLVDRKLRSKGDGKAWLKMTLVDLSKLLGVDGLIFPEILSATMLKAVAYDEYSLEVLLKMFNKEGENLGNWSESASKRKIALPTSPIGALATIAEAALDESAKKHMRLVVYDLGWKISQILPDSAYEEAIPEILSVDSNIDKGIFAAGDIIELDLNAEDGLKCTFDIGDFKKSIPMSPISGGIYKGIYIVRKGDKASSQPLKIHLTKPNGMERTWIETAGAVTIDAIAPPAPLRTGTTATRKGIVVSWGRPEAEELNEFVIERSEKPIGDFADLNSTKDLNYLDAEVNQGKTYYYRIRSVDRIGNRSNPSKVRKSTVPFFDEVKLPEKPKGSLVPGLYSVTGESIIEEGEILKVVAGTRFRFLPGSKLLSKGVLLVHGSEKNSIVFEGTGWKGVHVAAKGRAEISHSDFTGCSPCMELGEGRMDVETVYLRGDDGSGFTAGEGGRFLLKDLSVEGFNNGIVINGARGVIEECTVTKNDHGLEFSGGELELTNNNIFGNFEQDLISREKLVIGSNFLGTDMVKSLKIQGDILVTSLLDAPYPHGRKIILIDKADITPEKIEAVFQKKKALGMKAFAQRKFGDAHQYITDALSMKDDKDLFLYLAYTEMILGEEAKSERTLERGIKAFPYEVKLYEVYAKSFATRGKKAEAILLLEKALTMNPDDKSLSIMKDSLLNPPGSSGDAKDFIRLKVAGIDAFKKRDFKEAERLFKDALSVGQDKGTYLYLAYAEMNIGDEEALKKTLESGIAAFPNESRFYQTYAKYLSSKGEIKEALSFVDRGLKAKPNDRNLQMMKEYLSR